MAKPLSVLHIGLPARHVPDVGGVHEQELEVILEQEIDRLPVDAGRLHRHMGDAELLKPVAHGQQVGRHRRELGAKLRAFAGPVRYVDAGGHLLLVDVERAAALKQKFHLEPPNRSDSQASSVGGPWLRDSGWRARSNSSGCRGPPGPYCSRTLGARTSTASGWTTA